MSFDLADFQTYVTNVRSKPTARRYVIAVTSFLTWAEPVLGRIPVSRFPPNTLSLYTQSLLSKDYKPASIKLHQAGVSRYLRWLKEIKGVSVPDFHQAELPRVNRALIQYFQYADKLEEPIRTAVMLLPCSGLRSQEIVSLSLGSSLKRSPFKLQDGTTKETVCLVFGGKGGNERIVPLVDEGVKILYRYLKGWRATNSDSRYLFPGNKGSHISTRTVRAAVQSIREKLGMEFTPHTMRRTYLTTLYRKGVDVTLVAKIAGHSVKILMEHYLALDETDVVGAVHAMGGRLTT